MKLHNSMVGDINGRIQTILVESVRLGYVIHDLEVGEYHISKTFRHLFEVFISLRYVSLPMLC